MPVTVFVEDTASGFLRQIEHSSVTFGQTINDSTPFSISVPIGSEADTLLLVNRSIVHVDRNGQILYSGLLRARRDSSATVLEAAGGDLISYVRNDCRLRTTQDFSAGYEQFEIVASVLGIAAADGGILGLQLRRNPLNSGTLRTTAYFAHERKPVGEVLTDLAEAQNGFEFVQTSTWSGTTVSRFIDVWSPRVGQVLTQTWDEGAEPGHFADGGQIAVEVRRTIDGSRHATRQDVIGAEPGASKVIGVAVSTGTGYPRFDRVLSRTDIPYLAFLNALAAGELARNDKPAETLQATIFDTDSLGSWNVGDQVFIVSARLNITAYYRVISWSASDSANGFTLTAELALGLPLGKPVRSPQAQLVADDREVIRRLAKQEGI